MSAHNNKNSSRKLCHIATFLSCVALVMSPIIPLAAAPAHEFDDEARWFQVELILFSQQTDLALDAEQWPDIQGLELPEKLLKLSLPSVTANADDPDTRTNDALSTNPKEALLSPEQTLGQEPGSEAIDEGSDMPTAHQILPTDQLQLTNMANAIQRSSKRNLLLHVSWQQPTYDRKQAEPTYLFSGMADPLSPAEMEMTEDENSSALAPSLNENTFDNNTLNSVLEYATEEDAKIGPEDPQFTGTVTLSVERYLHIATDLIYRRPVTQHSPTPIPDLDLWYDRPYPTLKEPQGPAFQQTTWQAVRGFQLKESRRMRSKEIHYLDHPFMGMVVVITTVELPEPAEEIQQTSPQNILSTPTRPRNLQ